MIDPKYRLGEEQSLDRVRLVAKNENIVLGSQNVDFSGTDLVDATDPLSFGGYVRTRSGLYLDLSFNGLQALRKLYDNVKKYKTYWAVLQHAHGHFSDPDFFVKDQQIYDLKRFSEEVFPGNVASFLRRPYSFGFKGPYTNSRDGSSFYLVCQKTLEPYLLDSITFHK